jgi:hypothetical protein
MGGTPSQTRPSFAAFALLKSIPVKTFHDHLSTTDDLLCIVLEGKLFFFLQRSHLVISPSHLASFPPCNTYSSFFFFFLANPIYIISVFLESFYRTYGLRVENPYSTFRALRKTPPRHFVFNNMGDEFNGKRLAAGPGRIHQYFSTSTRTRVCCSCGPWDSLRTFDRKGSFFPFFFFDTSIGTNTIVQGECIIITTSPSSSSTFSYYWLYVLLPKKKKKSLGFRGARACLNYARRYRFRA